MTNYDSILKEKKKYEEKEEVKKFPTFKLAFLSVLLILVISYIVYFVTVLTPNMIFLNDISYVCNKYKSMFNYLSLDKINNIEGSIKFDNNIYNFILRWEDEVINSKLNLNEDTLVYYSDFNLEYLKLLNYDNIYYELDNIISPKSINNIKEYFINISEDKFIKNIYLDKTNLIVESNLILNNDDIMRALGLSNLEESYEVLFTFKNNAFTNGIISMKITINNLSSSKRSVITYENGYLSYKDDNYNLKFILDNNKLQIYNNDILHSVLRKEESSDSLEYIYQIIDKGYNLILTVNKDNENVSLLLTSKIDEDGTIVVRNLEITYHEVDNLDFENNSIDGLVEYNSLSDIDKKEFKIKLDNILNPLREFINKHKYSIN